MLTVRNEFNCENSMLVFGNNAGALNMTFQEGDISSIRQFWGFMRFIIDKVLIYILFHDFPGAGKPPGYFSVYLHLGDHFSILPIIYDTLMHGGFL